MNVDTFATARERGRARTAVALGRWRAVSAVDTRRHDLLSRGSQVRVLPGALTGLHAFASARRKLWDSRIACGASEMRGHVKLGTDGNRT